MPEVLSFYFYPGIEGVLIRFFAVNGGAEIFLSRPSFDIFVKVMNETYAMYHPEELLCDTARKEIETILLTGGDFID